MTQLPTPSENSFGTIEIRHKWCMAGFVVVATFGLWKLSLALYLLKLMINGDCSIFQMKRAKCGFTVLMPAIGYIILTLIINLNFRLYDNIQFNPVSAN